MSDVVRPRSEAIEVIDPEWEAFDYFDDDDDEFDCPAGPDGCPLAGTEECDWECPHHD